MQDMQSEVLCDYRVTISGIELPQFSLLFVAGPQAVVADSSKAFCRLD